MYLYESELYQNVILQFLTEEHWYVYSNIMVTSANVLTSDVCNFHLTKQVGIVVMFSTCIQEVPDSNLGQLAHYPDWGFCSFPQFLHVNASIRQYIQIGLTYSTIRDLCKRRSIVKSWKIQSVIHRTGKLCPVHLYTEVANILSTWGHKEHIRAD
jgi:hypothetical protein